MYTPRRAMYLEPRIELSALFYVLFGSMAHGSAFCTSVSVQPSSTYLGFKTISLIGFGVVPSLLPSTPDLLIFHNADFPLQFYALLHAFLDISRQLHGFWSVESALSQVLPHSSHLFHRIESGFFQPAREAFSRF